MPNVTQNRGVELPKTGGNLPCYNVAENLHMSLQPPKQRLDACMPSREKRITIGGASLSDRDITILKMVSEGLGNKEIAQQLGMVMSTLEKILGNTDDSRSLYRRINVQNRAAAVAWWVEHRDELEEYGGVAIEQLPATEVISIAEKSSSLGETKFDLLRVAITVTAIITCYLIIFFAVFVPTFLQGCRNCPQNLWSNVYLIVPLIGGMLGALYLILTKRYRIWPWGWALSLFSIGLLFWAMGGIAWLWYNVYGHTELPYPSAADYAYAANAVLMCIAVLILWWRYVGSRKMLVPLAVISGISCLLTIYGSLSVRNWQMLPTIGDPNKLMFDIYYPTIDTVLTVAFFQVFRTLVSSRSTPLLKGAFSLLLAGLVFNYFADITFCLTTSVPPSNPFAFYNGGISDFAYVTALFLIGLSIQVIPLVGNEAFQALS
ncbi:MAG: LuxR C-terminal-related transcriptional regulator [Kouleothrix sp.]